MFETVTKLFSFSKWCTSSSRNSVWLTDLRSRLKFWNKSSITINRKNLSHKVIYLGNVPTFWARGDQFIEPPLNILWKNYQRKKGKKALTKMKIVICNSGMKAYTRELGEIEYWSNKITYVANLASHPRVFLWVYRHTGKRGKPELRCHAVLCKKSNEARELNDELREKLFNALREFRREIYIRQQHPHKLLPPRKKFLVKGSIYFKQPLERSQSAPKLNSIQEDDDDGSVESSSSSSSLSISFKSQNDNNQSDRIGNSILHSVSTGNLNFTL
ncbi:Phosphotyrosine interaction domain containing protein [Sarcoptes scabiei]|uniref:Phosphotyrosine interaction domain containing protein n=1 Tax=Sarcoptes scabiei TaxID=52283 RepID=A0A132ABR8_SARSC|nr:Phosphotyrosine interaction domain containing protein [Sarcoptes scabiei]